MSAAAPGTASRTSGPASKAGRPASSASATSGAGWPRPRRRSAPGSSPLLRLDNVILSPHGIGLTDELFRLGGRSASRAVLAIADGHIPEFPLNPAVLARS